jgi:cytochrome c biogenesis protein CcmG, thiol:disulfide interchange protein DsbE
MSEIANRTPTPASATGAKRRVETRRAVLGLGLASAIVGGAWYIGGRSGFDQIGRGGANQDLLPKVGEPAPDFTAVSLTADIVSLSDYRGKPVWLNFWGSWCPPCRAEMPDIQAAYEQLAPKGLVLLAVSLGDAPDQAAQFAARNHVTFTVLVDPNRKLTSAAYPIYNFPTHIFIDEGGTVRKIVLSEMSTEQAIANARSILPDSA